MMIGACTISRFNAIKFLKSCSSCVSPFLQLYLMYLYINKNMCDLLDVALLAMAVELYPYRPDLGVLNMDGP
jgi:hypothetical protein